MNSTSVICRAPRTEDGSALHALVRRCEPLDQNSMYCNLLQCSHFAVTAAAAEQSGELVGFVSGYRVPARPRRLFVWQVAVDPRVRGQGLGRRLIQDILVRPDNRDIDHIETTITPSNEPSWALFRGLARRLGAVLNEELMFARDRHFEGQKEDEILLTIGPFTTPDENPQR